MTGLTVLSSATHSVVKILYKYSSCIRTLSYFQYSLQAKNYQSYKMGTIRQINIKNRNYYFYNIIINLKNFESKLLKIDKKSYIYISYIYKTSVFPTLDILQLKKLMIVKIFTA